MSKPTIKQTKPEAHDGSYCRFHVREWARHQAPDCITVLLALCNDKDQTIDYCREWFPLTNEPKDLQKQRDFFVSIGLAKPSEPFTPDWNMVQNKEGVCFIKPVTHNEVQWFQTREGAI